MKFTLNEIRVMKDPLGRLLEAKIPMIAAFKLNKLTRFFEENLKDIEDARVRLIKELGEPVKESEGDFQVPNEKVPEFLKKFGEFLETEVEYDYEPIKIDTFADAEISTNDMYALEKLFRE